MCIRRLAGGGSNTSRNSSRRHASHSRRSSGMQCTPHIWWSPSHLPTGTTVKASHARYLGDMLLSHPLNVTPAAWSAALPRGRCSALPGSHVAPCTHRACPATLQLRLSNCTPPASPGRVLHSHLLHAKLLHVQGCLGQKPARMSPLRPLPDVPCPLAAASQQPLASCRSGG